MTVITITTVGFAEQFPLSQGGQALTIALLVAGLGIFFFLASEIGRSIMEGELRHYLGRVRRSRMKGHEVVCGYGRMGRAVVDELQRAGRTVVVVDSRVSRMRKMSETGLPTVTGDATLEATLLTHSNSDTRSNNDKSMTHTSTTQPARHGEAGVGGPLDLHRGPVAAPIQPLAPRAADQSIAVEVDLEPPKDHPAGGHLVHERVQPVDEQEFEARRRAANLDRLRGAHHRRIEHDRRQRDAGLFEGLGRRQPDAGDTDVSLVVKMLPPPRTVHRPTVIKSCAKGPLPPPRPHGVAVHRGRCLEDRQN